MVLECFDLSQLGKYQLIKDVVVRPLKVNRDPRGILVEMIKETWSDVYGEKYPFSQSYFSRTESNVARDEDQWHLHPTKQTDRFVVLKGRAVFALLDKRPGSETEGKLNLFLMGELDNDHGYYLLLVPQGVLHGFLVVSAEPAWLVNFPDQVYDPQEEGRIKLDQVKLGDGGCFDWNQVRRAFSLPLKEKGEGGANE